VSRKSGMFKLIGKSLAVMATCFVAAHSGSTSTTQTAPAPITEALQ
jgi:hypothetical protein